ncbi:hypothetical protein [Streptomyces sp. AB3(2024)]|uniref:hypothetical protein n=1 Tax=Streptomyces sp. AB3(2024) TaxID=3317321 RepID=UPI0035A3AB24
MPGKNSSYDDLTLENFQMEQVRMENDPTLLAATCSSNVGCCSTSGTPVGEDA